VDVVKDAPAVTVGVVKDASAVSGDVVKDSPAVTGDVVKDAVVVNGSVVVKDDFKCSGACEDLVSVGDSAEALGTFKVDGIFPDVLVVAIESTFPLVVVGTFKIEGVVVIAEVIENLGVDVALESFVVLIAYKVVSDFPVECVVEVKRAVVSNFANNIVDVVFKIGVEDAVQVESFVVATENFILIVDSLVSASELVVVGDFVAVFAFVIAAAFLVVYTSANVFFSSVVECTMVVALFVVAGLASEVVFVLAVSCVVVILSIVVV
jgi:hypothetical protein